MRYLSVVAFFSLLFAGSFLFWHDKFQAVQTWSGQGVDNLARPSLSVNQSITLFFVGDMMLDRGVAWQIKKHNNDWTWPFLRVAETLRKADLVFGNLESVISNKGENLGSVYSFRADPKAIEGLVFAGFDVVSVANNHSFDYGPEAFVDSINRLKNAGISHLGGGFSKTEAHNPFIKESQGTKIGFLAYTNAGSPLWQATENTPGIAGHNPVPGIAWVDAGTLLEFQEDIKTAKEQSDVLVVSLHFGEEYQKEPSPVQELLSKTAIEAGADLVVGHHPHVVQPVERYKSSLPAGRQGWIAYSLGNFVFDQGFSPETMEGLLLEVKVAEKQITQVIPRVIRINSFFQPTLE